MYTQYQQDPRTMYQEGYSYPYFQEQQPYQGFAQQQYPEQYYQQNYAQTPPYSIPQYQNNPAAYVPMYPSFEIPAPQYEIPSAPSYEPVVEEISQDRVTAFVEAIREEFFTQDCQSSRRDSGVVRSPSSILALPSFHYAPTTTTNQYAAVINNDNSRSNTIVNSNVQSRDEVRRSEAEEKRNRIIIGIISAIVLGAGSFLLGGRARRVYQLNDLLKESRELSRCHFGECRVSELASKAEILLASRRKSAVANCALVVLGIAAGVFGLAGALCVSEGLIVSGIALGAATMGLSLFKWGFGGLVSFRERSVMAHMRILCNEAMPSYL